MLGEVKRGGELIASLEKEGPPASVTNPGQHLVPRQFAWMRAAGDPGIQPQLIARDDHTLLYRFKPEAAIAQRFEKIGGGPGYIWGSGVGYVEYLVPAPTDHRRVGRLVVRAHLQPVLPVDGKPSQIKTRVTLYVNGSDYGSRLIPVETTNPAWKLAGESPDATSSTGLKGPLVQEWSIDTWSIRLRAARGLPIMVRFAVTVDSDWLYGINISNWPEGYDAHDAKPIEVEVR